MLIDEQEFRDQIKKDVGWSKHDFENSCFDFTTINQRYIDLISKRLKALKKKEDEKNRMYKKRYNYYKNEYKMVLAPAEAKSYTEADDEYLKVKQEYDTIEGDIKYLDRVLENLSQKYWHMKLWEQYKEFTKGER